MTRDITPIKWIIGAIALLIIIAGACYLWYRYDTAPYRQEAAKTAEVARQWEVTQKANNKAEQAADMVSVESTTPTAEKPVNEVTGAETDKSTDEITKPVTAATQKTENAEEVRVSPHGFGPYPEIPEDFPKNVNWANYENDLPIYELMIRVRIKLWKEGHRTAGIGEENGLLYPIMRGTVYIQWSDNGEDIIGITGHPEDMSDAVVDQIYESGTFPAWLTVINREKAGIDPYKFLNLQ
ncbi:MAG: hypothetical protein OXU23_11420 [Candidatus Poribacteria bacterium]|nr:hypothetical protein [Candidatus Poribacteria bacterium]